VLFKKEADKILMHELFLDMHIHPSIVLSSEKKSLETYNLKLNTKYTLLILHLYLITKHLQSNNVFVFM